MVVSAAPLSMCHWELNGPQSAYLLALTSNWIWPGQLKQQLRFIELLLLVNVMITFPSRSRKGRLSQFVFLSYALGLWISVSIQQINSVFALCIRSLTLILFPRCMEKKYFPRFSTSVEHVISFVVSVVAFVSFSVLKPRRNQMQQRRVEMHGYHLAVAISLKKLVYS